MTVVDISTVPPTPGLVPRSAPAGTQLDAMLSGVPWVKEMELGLGFNALTGALCPSALTYTAPGAASTVSHSSHLTLTTIRTEEDLTSLLKASASGSYNMEGATIAGSASLLDKVKVSTVSMTMLAEWSDVADGYESISDVVPTAAATTAAADPERFRATYGDYFFSAALRGSRFRALYSLQSTDSEQLLKFQAEISAKAPDLFDAKGSIDFETSVAAHNLTVTIDVVMDGYSPDASSPPPQPKTPEDVAAALAWFQAHANPTLLKGRLTHFSALIPVLPTTVNVDPDAFARLQQLRLGWASLNAAYNSMPPRAQSTYAPQLQRVTGDIDGHRADLVTDATAVQECQAEVATLKADVDAILERADFLDKLNKTAETDGGQHDAGTQTTWSYGYDKYPGTLASLSIETESFPFEGDYDGPGHVTHTFQWSHSERIIVGWVVTSNWTDGSNGYWNKSSDNRILGSSTAEIYVSSQYDRGTSWTLTIHSALATDLAG